MSIKASAGPVWATGLTDAGLKQLMQPSARGQNSVWGRMDLRADPFSKQPLQLNLSLNTGIGVRCLPGAYSSARTLLKTRCARLKTDPWSNNF